MNGLVQTLVPSRGGPSDAVPLIDIPDCLWEPTGPLAEDQERLPALFTCLWWISALPVGVNDRQAPDVAEVLGEVGDHLTEVSLTIVSHEQRPRLKNP